MSLLGLFAGLLPAASGSVFVRSFVQSFVRWFVSSFVRSFIRSFVRSFVRSVHSARNSGCHFLDCLQASCQQPQGLSGDVRRPPWAWIDTIDQAIDGANCRYDDAEEEQDEDDLLATPQALVAADLDISKDLRKGGT